EGGGLMPFFHPLSHTRALVARLYTSSATLHLRHFPVHNFKKSNPISIPHLSHFNSLNLLQMHQTRHRAPNSYAHRRPRKTKPPNPTKRTQKPSCRFKIAIFCRPSRMYFDETNPNRCP